MFQHDRTCCVCRDRGLAVQIHHIDENPSNHAITNLAVLCLEDHEQTQVRGGFGKKLKAADVTRFRDDWVSRVSARRDKADEIVIQHTVGLAVSQKSVQEWQAPSEARIIGFVNALPNIRAAAMVAARPLWNTGITSEVRQGSYDAIETLERAWLQLAVFYPPNHFGDVPADHFFQNFISRRFEWHRKIAEPRGPGSSGTIVHVIVGGAVLSDVANAIAETVEGLFIGYALFPNLDMKNWRDRWAAADSSGAENQVDGESIETLLDVVVGLGGSFEEKRSNGLYQTKHTFSVAVRNNDSKRFLSNCKLFLELPDKKDGALKSYLLTDTFTLNPSEERYVPIVSYDEPATVSRHAGDRIYMHVPVGAGYDVGYGWPWQLPVEAYSITLRAICKETPPSVTVCKAWVDSEAKLHFEKA